MTDDSNSRSPDAERPPIAVAVSGGGHRATAWALGAISALVETGLNRDVVSVASVSGGSIANGAVANADTDLSEYTSSKDFAESLRPTLDLIAKVGLFPASPPTMGWVLGLLGAAFAAIISIAGLVTALVAANQDHALATYAIVGVIIGVVLAVVVVLLTKGSDNVLVKSAGRLLAVLLLVYLPLVTWGGAATVSAFEGWGVLIPIVGWVVLICLLMGFALGRLAARGEKVADVLGTTVLAGSDGQPRMLGDVDSTVNHVICTTDLEAADQFYLAPRFLNGYREGITMTGQNDVTLAAAVQASAALPGGFPPSIIETGTFERKYTVSGGVPEQPPTRVVVSDGGVYDNMGDQWERGYRGRLRRLEELADVQQPARIIVVANASGAWTWSPFEIPKISLVREVLGLLRDQGVQYDVSTARRRSAMFQEWQTTEQEILDGKETDGLMGTLAMIDRSPLDTLRRFLDDTSVIHTPGKDDRAREAVAFLEGIEEQKGKGYWAELASTNKGVATVLDAIGVGETLGLMEQSYTLAMVGLYVFNGVGRLTPFPDCYEKVLAG